MVSLRCSFSTKPSSRPCIAQRPVSISSTLGRLESAQRCGRLSRRLLPGRTRCPVLVQATSDESAERDEATDLVGEDAAYFDLQEQKLISWSIFSALLAGALGVLYLVWISPSTGYGDEFVELLSGVTKRSDVTMCAILFIFAIAHSGLAGLRPYGEKVIGARAFRVLFAGVSLPLATSAIVFFVNHRYDGAQLWMLQNEPWMHPFVWTVSFLSFFFLYPSTFNLLEVAAVDEPKLHLWETGVTRITRHPQAIGQAMWCFAHTLWVGNTFTLITSLGLMLHHAFGCWHGDRRLAAKHGEAFEAVKKRTSTLPFQAIIEGRQELPPDYYKELLRFPYLIIAGATVGAYLFHPIMFRASYHLGW
ncbi:hypothetical protein BSKO_01537 [Bryopsis sp. KO-2023]|nr:hypothetical protein BSKO_01537 [Bryopsis sp. KO-2023]